MFRQQSNSPKKEEDLPRILQHTWMSTPVSVHFLRIHYPLEMSGDLRNRSNSIFGDGAFYEEWSSDGNAEP